MSNTVTIMLVDDHAIVREGYRSLLQKQAEFEVICEAGDGNEAYNHYKHYQPDVVVMDISLPGQSGLKAIERIRQYDGSARVLVFSMHQNPSFALQATRAGALGYITKSSEPEALIRAIHQVAQNKHTLSADIAQALAMEKLGQEQSALDELTVREFEILRLLVDAKSNQAIAELLNISPKTVSNSHYIIKKKLGVSSDIELTRLAIKMNLVNLLDLVDEAPGSE
ncbi:response regulator transcription factor [Methylophaga sp. OBS1]|uniref:response regulator n=1 Tax=Methylophaga sp. OBS1 TaxID=2991933 RepID=UPI00225A736A|nr:response regulator transcription factor [Methylophaga sp. OBS1]MCX4190915.1 response regulator transcription factor [Methylophaga sp. OBS1]MCX4192139.1 response regulator transcription factor [Methylophaga sp. OBS1]